jgi:uncharacterized protein with PIN domain
MRERSRHARYDTVAPKTAPMDDRIRSAARADDADGSPGAAPPMARARFRFHGELRDLLPRAWRDALLERDCAREATVKHAVEALGVPHTEIGRVRVDGRPADPADRVPDGVTVDIHPRGLPAPGAPRFVVDAHLGALARRLRLLGFDCLLARHDTDRAIATLAARDARAVLSRDRELLKHRSIERGRYVRGMRTDAQLREVLDAFGLRAHVRPFTRCLECNGLLRPASLAEVAARLPPGVAGEPHRYTRCDGCCRIYWDGSHWRRLAAAVATALAEPAPTP